MRKPKPGTPEPRRYRLCDWEENGYHDSYGYMAYFDEADGLVHKMETWATAYPGGVDQSQFLMPDVAIVERAVKWLAGVIFDQIKEAEYHDIYEPDAVQRGDWLLLLREVKHRNQVYPEGTRGEVFWSGAFGQFFKKGYNRPCRTNTRVGLRLGKTFEDGQMYVALSACRRAKDPLSDEELRSRSDALARHCQFKRALTTHGGWLSHNWALDVLRRHEESEKRPA